MVVSTSALDQKSNIGTYISIMVPIVIPIVVPIVIMVAVMVAIVLEKSLEPPFIFWIVQGELYIVVI